MLLALDHSRIYYTRGPSETAATDPSAIFFFQLLEAPHFLVLEQKVFDDNSVLIRLVYLCLNYLLVLATATEIWPRIAMKGILSS